ncbi:MAG: GntR family transcriptional regulator [Colwellia sp.]|nr:GntR family transcriptional regulator [Colwellia sp.]
MKISVNIEHSNPLFTQLIEQIKKAVLNNDIAAGDALPSIRQLANDLDINHKTVAKAYRLLERDGVIQTKGYRGTFIHQNAKENSTINLNEWVLSELDKTLTSFRELGITESEMRIAFNSLINSRHN